MRYYLVVVLGLVINTFLFGQNLPDDFHLEKKALAKISNSTPKSNSISDIIIVGDTIWLGTSRGLSRSTDNGETWTNYFEHPDFGTESIPALSYNYNTRTIWASTMHVEDKGGDLGLVRVGTGFRYSSDGGETWTSVPQPVDAQSDSVIQYGINELYILPTTVQEQNITYDIDFTENYVWIASWSSGLRRSADKGKTWERIVMPADYLSSISPMDTLDFEIDPRHNNNHMYFSVLAIDNNTIYAGSAAGINKTTDANNDSEKINWKRFSHQNQEEPISGNWVIGLEQNLYDNSIWAVTRKADDLDEYFGISSTHNGGNSWKTFLPGANGNNIGFRYYVENNLLNGADVIFCTDEGAYRTSNNGGSWILQPTIKDDNSGLVINSQNILNASAKSFNNNEAEVWLGTTGGLAKLSETSSMWQGTWKVYLAAESISEGGNKSFAFPNPFAAGLETTSIKYSTGSTGGQVTIRILDFGMNLVKTIIQNAYRNSGDENIELWDGYDENGNRVANGVYFYRIDVNSNEPVYGKIMVMR